MPEIALTRSPHARRLYVLEGVGTLRLQGWGGRRAGAEGDGRTWRFARRGLFGRTVQAADATGDAAGEFRSERMRRGGTVRWGAQRFALWPASRWRERYALADAERELAVLDGRGWGRRPVTVVVGDLGAVDPGLLLFATFVVRGLAEDGGAAAAAATSAGG